MVKQFINKFVPQGSFKANVLTLMTGVGISQVILVFFSPILTRFYTPSDFGVLALYIAVTSIPAAISSARYEMAIMLPEKDEDAINIVALSLGIVLGVSFLTFLTVWLLNVSIAKVLGNYAISVWLYFVPVSVFFIGMFQVQNCWLNRKKRYSRMSTRQVLQSGSMIITQVGLGSVQVGSGGLVTGLIVGQFIAAGVFAFDLWKEDRCLIQSVALNRMRELLVRFRNFPAFSLPSEFIYSLTLNIPVMLLSRFFNAQVVGSFAFSEIAVGMPFAFIASPINRVFRERACHDFNKQGHCNDIYKKTFKGLYWYGLIPLLILILFSPHLFVFIFGDKWKEAGEYAQLLAVVAFLHSLADTLGCTFDIAGKQKYWFLWNVALCVLIASSFLIGGWLLKSPKTSIFIYAAAYSLMYGVQLCMSYSYSKKKGSAC